MAVTSSVQGRSAWRPSAVRTSVSGSTARRTVPVQSTRSAHRFNQIAAGSLVCLATETLARSYSIGATWGRRAYFEVNAALMSRVRRCGVCIPCRPRTSKSSCDEAWNFAQEWHHRRGPGSDPRRRVIGDARVALTTLDTAMILARADRIERRTSSRSSTSRRHARRSPLSPVTRHALVDQHQPRSSNRLRARTPTARYYWLRHDRSKAGESPRFLARRLVILAMRTSVWPTPMGSGAGRCRCSGRRGVHRSAPEGRPTLARATPSRSRSCPRATPVTRALGRGDARGARGQGLV